MCSALCYMFHVVISSRRFVLICPVMFKDILGLMHVQFIGIFFFHVVVSDDNSSIQSSPWQRDHCWKQTVPRKNVNRELEFSMRFVRRRKIRFSSLAIRRKRRRPYDAATFDINEILKEDSVILKDNSSRKLSCKGRKKLNEIIQKLLERRSYESAASSCRTDPGIVSPRKRILKEMEKVSLEEMGNMNKKHRARTIASSASANTVSVITGSVSSPAVISAASTATITSKSANNHSITSILSRDLSRDEEQPSFLRNLLKSPNDTSSESKSSFTAESPSSADVRISQNRPSHCSTPITASLSPPYPKNLHCPQPIPSFIQPTYLYHTTQPFLTSPPISNHPPYYSPFPSNYRDPSAWSLPSVSSLPRQSIYPTASVPTYPSLNPSPWIPVAHSSFQSYSVTENGNGK